MKNILKVLAYTSLVLAIILINILFLVAMAKIIAPLNRIENVQPVISTYKTAEVKTIKVAKVVDETTNKAVEEEITVSNNTTTIVPTASQTVVETVPQTTETETVADTTNTAESLAEPATNGLNKSIYREIEVYNGTIEYTITITTNEYTTITVAVKNNTRYTIQSKWNNVKTDGKDNNGIMMHTNVNPFGYTTYTEIVDNINEITFTLDIDNKDGYHDNQIHIPFVAD